MPRIGVRTAPSRGQNPGSGELALLREIRARTASAAHPGLSLGIGDDCALLRLRRDEEFAVTTDLSIAGRHFRLDWHPPESIGHRTLARGLSDLAAMGARPVAAFLSLGLPAELTRPEPSPRANRLGSSANPSHPSTWMSRFLDGLLGLAQLHNTPLAGGDLAESPLAVADIVLTGAVPRSRALLRAGARPGDQLYVTGALGGSAAAFQRLQQIADETKPSNAVARSPQSAKVRKRKSGDKSRHVEIGAISELCPHLFPQPRLAQGQWLVRHRAATAAIDLSDGLSTDLNHLCEESAVAAEVVRALLPIHPGATIDQALHGGEDYELLFTASESIRLPRSIAGVPITRIGTIQKPRRTRPAVTLLAEGKTEPITPHGWQHFA